MIGSHSRIYTHPEPYVLLPLKYLGYFDTVDKAPYEHIQAAQAFREFCQELPHGQADYLDACRAYASLLYDRVLAPTGKSLFLDKTPEYALALPFITQLYPRAKYIVLTRHPLAIWHSQAHSFYGGSYQESYEFDPSLPRYVRAIGQFLRERPVSHVQVRYEDLVQSPAQEMRRVFDYLGLDFEEGVIEYGRHPHISKSFGDPISINKYDQPGPHSLYTWAQDLLARPEALDLARQIVEPMAAGDLEAWGYPKSEIFSRLTVAAAVRSRFSPFHSYRFKKRVLLALRKNIHQNALGRLVKRIRYYCDVLLRTT